jgi:hypothetical protein
LKENKIIITTVKKHVKIHEKAGSAAQVVQHLPSKCEALSSNPSNKNFLKIKKLGGVAHTCHLS